MTINEIQLQDVMQFLKEQPDKSADYIIADPPYGIGFDGGDKWDHIDSEESYLEWMRQWTNECARILKDGRMLTVWGTLKTDTFLRYKLEVLNKTGLTSQNEIIWSYNWGGRSKKNFARKHEVAWNYSQGEEFVFNADDVRIERKVTKNYRTGKQYEKGTIPTLIWEKNNHTMSKDYIAWHPTPKNIDVLMRMILAYSNEGDTIIDLFSGSGNTAVAALRTGRNFIGCDNNPHYHDLRSERLSDCSSFSFHCCQSYHLDIRV